jgi:CO/xanthine dehydrogenase Mo-binding subunit
VVQCIEAAAERFGWNGASRQRTTGAVSTMPPADGGSAHFSPDASRKRESIVRGRGFAAGFKNIGFSFGYQENCWAKVEIHGKSEIDHVLLHQAAAEVGQGNHTLMVQMAAEAVGVPFEKVKLIASDSATMENSGSASASRLTFMTGNAIRGAAEVALKKWKAEERPAIGEFKYLAPRTNQFDKETG